MKFWRNDELESHTAGRLAEYERKTGRAAVLPIPIELIAECLFDLRICYDTIVAPPGHTVLGCFCPGTKTITVNEAHRELFTNKPGLERFTIGHELGHWDLFEQHADRTTGDLFGGGAADARIECRTGSGVLGRYIQNMWTSHDSYELLSFVERAVDNPMVASAVNRFASALLMPKHLLVPAVAHVDRWRDLYLVAEKFGVSISALRVRLQRLRILHVTDDGKPVKGSKEEYAGQQRIV